MTIEMGPDGSEPGPPDDPVFQHLLEQALYMDLGVSVAEVPMKHLRRFANHHRPELSRLGREVVDAIKTEWAKGRPPRLWVYSKPDHFVVSDDYHSLAAAEERQASSVPVYIIGIYPKNLDVEIKGVLAKSALHRMFGMETT